MCNIRDIRLKEVGKICEKCLNDDTYFKITGEDSCPVLDIPKCGRRNGIVLLKIKCPCNLWEWKNDKT